MTTKLSSLFVVLGISVFLISCELGKQRYQKSNILQNLENVYQSFPRNHRSGNVYFNYKLVLEIDAILRDTHYLQAIAQTTGVELPPASTKKRLEFALIVYEPDHARATDFNNRWTTALNFDKTTLGPENMYRLDKKSVEYVYLKSRFYSADSWSEIFILSFNLPPAIQDKILANDEALLSFKSILGTTILKWDNLGELLTAE